MIDLHWLDGTAPSALPGGTTWGVPLHHGQVRGTGELALTDAGGAVVPAQFWPLATWPDGSLKWVGAAIGATDSAADGYAVRTGAAGASVGGLTVTETVDAITVDTGVLTCVVARSGRVLVRSIARGGVVVAGDGALVSLLQHELPEDGSAARTACTGEVTAVTVEQDGPVRAVLRIEGGHRSVEGSFRWLPFVVRLVFAAGGRSIRMVHTFVWDGDAERDFLAGLGVRFAVPLRAAPHDRHVRIAGDLWLWYSYLTGRAEVFRLAEAMTRHTGEVDVYHLGRWRGLGTRHNVQHWGCSAKQLRISNPAYRRFYYYLTADERTGDLLSELHDSDATFLALDPLRKVRPDAAGYRPERGALGIGLGTDWGALAATWLTAWERTGDPRSRDRLLGTMADIGALKHGFFTGEALYDLDAGRFDTTRVRAGVSHLSAVFGLVEICSELIALVDVPEFERAWLQYCRLYLAPPHEQEAELGTPLHGIHLHQAHSRLSAYAAHRTGDAKHAERAWRAFHGGGEFASNRRSFQLRRIEPPHVLHEVDEAEDLSTNDASQLALTTIQLLALLDSTMEP